VTERSQQRLGDLGEEQLLALIGPLLAAGAPASPRVVVGPGDDTAVVATGAHTVATTDAMVRGLDWRDEWSTGRDVGHKTVAQNLADVAAMGAVPIGLLVTLAADPATPVAWALELAEGIGAAAGAAGCPVLGGDLSGAPAGVVMVSVTALGDLQGRPAVLRSGARAGDVVAVCGSLGLSGAGLALLAQGRPEVDPEAVAVHRRPRPPLPAGPAAARAGATALIDLSDGLLRDADRVARASGVRLALSRTSLSRYAARLTPALGADGAWDCVLGGGEEHSLLGCFPGPEQAAAGPEQAGPPEGWVAIGRVEPAAGGEPGVTLDGEPMAPRGWDHFAG